MYDFVIVKSCAGNFFEQVFNELSAVHVPKPLNSEDILIPVLGSFVTILSAMLDKPIFYLSKFNLFAAEFRYDDRNCFWIDEIIFVHFSGQKLYDPARTLPHVLYLAGASILSVKA